MFADASHLLAHNPPGLHCGVGVVALDGPRFGLFVTGFDGPNRLLIWNNGALRDVAPPVLADADRRAVAIASADLDGDGREELYVLNTDTFAGAKKHADRLFKCAPDGQWEDLFARPGNAAVRNLAAGRSVVAIDRRGVGRYGFFVANCDRPMRLYELAPGGGIADLAPALDLARTAGGRGAIALPLFSHFPDLFCANEGGANFAYRNHGDGTFAEAASHLKLTDTDEHARGAAAFDAGGAFGLCWANWDGPHRLMVPKPDGTFRDAATPGFAFPSAARTVVAADFDNDGTDEVFFNQMAESNRLFRVQPCEAGIEVTKLEAGDATDADGCGTGAAVCDIDGDGVLELIVSRGEKLAQPLSIYKARNASPNYLRVRPLTRFGAPARGAVVRAEYGGRVRVKGVCAGSGYLCQMEPVAHFGLGAQREADRVSVTWPDGAEVVLLNPGGNRTLNVPYPRG